MDPKKEWEDLAKKDDTDQRFAANLMSLHGGCVKPDSLVVVLLGKQWYWTVLLPQHYLCYDVMTKQLPQGLTYRAIADAPLSVLDEAVAVKLPQGRAVSILIQNTEGPVHELKLRRLSDPNTFPLMSYTLDGPRSSVGDELQPTDKGARFYALAFHELAQVEAERRARQPGTPAFIEAPECNAERVLHPDAAKEEAAWKVAEELRSILPVGIVFDVVSAEDFAAWADAKAHAQ